METNVADVQLRAILADQQTKQTSIWKLLSLKSVKILSLFLIPPLFLALLWISIPLTKPILFAFIVETYYLTAFFAW